MLKARDIDFIKSQNAAKFDENTGEVTDSNKQESGI